MSEIETPSALSPDQEDIRVGKGAVNWEDAYERCRYVRGKKDNKRDELTDFQEIFVNEYMLDFSPMHAYIRAGGKAKNASSSAQQVLKVEKVADAIEVLKLDMKRRLAIQRDQIILELANITHVNAAEDFEVNDGKINVKEGRNRLATRAISGVRHKVSTTSIGDEVTVEHTVDYKTFDKNASARTLLQHLGELPERVRHSGPNGEALPGASPLVLIIKEVSETSNGENTTPPKAT